VPEPERLAERAASELGVHVLEQTDRFVLVGWDGKRGKLTFFGAEGPREAGALDRVVVSAPGGEQGRFELDDGLVIEVRPGSDGDLLGVVLRSRDPRAAQEGWQRLGLAPADGRGAGVTVGDALIELVGDAPEQPVGSPVLNHLGVLVESASDELAELRAREILIADVVDAPNTLAVFVEGPDGVKLEYVEHKQSFALA
jgi:catechol 2,3-dioxygenase-like lactoylglutathione lyase family enzyme